MGCACSTDRQIDESWDDFPLKEDGWVMSHEALRKNMREFKEVLEVINGVANDSKNAENPELGWMTSNIAEWYPFFHKLVHAHHDHEEETFFPFVKERVELPPRFSADHNGLIEALDKCGKMVEELQKASQEVKSSPLQDVEALQKEFINFCDMMEEHFKEEEKCIPLVREKFKPSEMHKLEKDKIIPTLQWYDTGNHIAPLDDTGKTKWMSEQGIPWVIQKLVIWPQVRKYNSKVQNLLDEIRVPEKREQKTEKIAAKK
uniref:Hemerythrin-like domain-containing protein n=1 Tax=Lotharella oceanica TaxID=641309 RepID=A0A7S2XF40_9EUKA|mmetsp:Transcript_35554/g.65862  ORF Transcript_35554/g.65862 Transcript_35554/m.65862 type:complete len:260 (+) Transcript_35554:92-871(+)